MKILGALIKTRLQALLSSFFGAGRTSAKVKKKKSKVGFIILAAYLIIIFIALFYMIFSQLAAAYCAMGLDWLYFTIFAIMSFGLMFVGSVFTAQTQLYEATDNEFLLSMPIPTKYILLSRMVSLGIFNLGYGLLVAIPAFFCYAIFGEMTFYKVIAFIVLLFAIVLFALAVTALFAWVIAAITGKMKSKTAFKLVLSLAFLGAYFVCYSKLWDYINTLAVTGEDVAEKVKSVAFLYYVGSGVGNGNIVHLLIVTAVFVAAFALVYRVLSMRFSSIALKNRGASKKKYVATKAKNRGASSALLRKEFARIGSSANYMMNCGLGVVFMIVVAVVAAVKKPDINGFLDGLGIFSAKDVCVVFSFAICYMQSLIDFTAPSVSLEGPYLWILQTMPVDGSKVLLAKVKAHVMIALPPTLLSSAIICIAYPGDIPGMLVAFVAPVLMCIFSALLGVLVNLRWPKFDWLDETVAVKQSGAVGIMLGIMFLFPIVFLVLYVLVSSFVSVCAAMWIFAAILAFFDILMYNRIVKRGGARFAALNAR